MLNIKYIQFLHVMAEIEASFGGADKLLFWRRQELKNLGIHYGDPIWIGRHLKILRRSNIVLGNRVALPYNTQLINYSPIKIGDDFIAASDLIIGSGHKVSDKSCFLARLCSTINHLVTM